MNMLDVDTRLYVRRAETADDIAACKALIVSVYQERYGVTFAGETDPSRKREPLPDHYVMGLVDGELVATAGLYTKSTYTERYGQISEMDLARALAKAGRPEAITRPRVEYTKLAVRPGWEGMGIGRQFLAATHSLTFLCTDCDQVPLLVACAKLSVFENLYRSVGIRTRTLKPFPWYKSHERYRSPDDPMESRIILPEMDIDSRWFHFPLPGTLDLQLSEASMQHEVAVGTCGAPPGRSPRTFVGVRVSALDMELHWRRCALTADYLAGFVEDVDAGDQRAELSGIIDELLENALKFCADADEPVAVTVRDYGDAIQLETSNLCDRKRAKDLERSMRRVLESDVERLFIEMVEETAASDPSQSRLGLITLRLNHGARLGARITRGNGQDLCRVTIEVLLDRQQEALAS